MSKKENNFSQGCLNNEQGYADLRSYSQERLDPELELLDSGVREYIEAHLKYCTACKGLFKKISSEEAQRL